MAEPSNKKRKRENASIIWDYFFEEYDEEEQQSYLICQLCRNKDITKRYKWTKGASTSTAQGHLWRDHKIDKNHPEEPEITGDIRSIIKHITSRRQLSLERSLIIFIILDCQPLNILRNNAFRDMLHNFEPGFKIPTEEKCKTMIQESYKWTKEHLQELLRSGANTVNITTDLWTSRRNDSYIGVIISWLDQEMKLYEALIGIELLPSPHTSENIKISLESILERWNLKEKCFAATTDNAANIKKAISLTNDNSIISIGCAAHTLHLSVMKGLAVIKQFTERVNNIILFFTLSPKQSDRLKKAQEERGFPKLLEVLQGVCTRWNSSYLAWKRLLELKVAIQWLANTLHLSYAKDDKDDGDYLKQIALTESEWR